MPFVPAPGVIQAELIYIWDNQVVETVLQFQATGTPTPPLMAELGEFLVDWFDTSMKSTMPTTIALTSVKLTDMTSQIAPVVIYGTGLPLAGTNVSPSLPNSVAVVITKRTLLRGRSYRGRIYHPGLTEAQVVANALASGLGAALIGIYDNLISFTTMGESWNMVVMSRVANGVERETADSNQVIALTTEGVVDSQRRRLPGRGA